MNKLWLAAIFFLFGFVVDAQFTCSQTQPCAIGCCTKFGSCGLGPDSCGPANCISNCDRKSDCDPGWGPQWSAKKTCPLNVCCSKYGFCGTTSEFCGNATVVAPSCSGSSSSKRTIGYYESWAIGRPCDKMYPEGIPIGAYTHLNFAFAFIHPTTFAIAPMSSSDPQLYSRFTALKNVNPGLQTWISIGGWSMNDPDQPTAATFSNLAGSTDAQSKFFTSVLSFLETYGFDGVDLDWEYPVAPERSGKPSDFTNYVTFLQNFRNALHSSGHNYGLTITIPSSFWYLQHFDIVSMEKTIDWFNLMSYDLHGTWDSTNKFLGPYIAAHTNLTEIDNALSLLWRNNINPGKVVLGLGFYGRSFTLADPSCTTAGCVFTSGARAGPCTQSVGTLSYAEIKRIVARGNKVIKDDTAAVKMVVYDTDQWVSYDDAETLKMKVDYANAHCLGGTMVWAVSTDNANASAVSALSLSTRRKASTTGPDSLLSCQLGDCGKPCPAGLSPAQRSGGKNKGNTGTNTGCSDGASRLYCCPSNDIPTCRWRGLAPFCGAVGGAKCTNSEVEVTSSTSGDGRPCWTGHKVLCCTKTASDSAAGHCEWRGSAPFCAAPFGQASCPSSQAALTKSTYGAGGEQPCFTGQKSFCCDQPPPYTGCDWYYHGGSFWSVPFRCAGTCPAGKALIATDPSWCWSGYGAFCCDNPSKPNDPLVEDFKSRISNFANDPTCSVGPSKRDSDLEYVPENRSLPGTYDLEKRVLSGVDLNLLFHQVSQIAHTEGRTSQQNLMAAQFDMLYGGRRGLHIADIAGFYNDWPNADPLSLSRSLLCMGSDANDFLSDYHRSRSRLCTNHCTRRPVISSVASTPRPSSAARMNDNSLFARSLGDSNLPRRRGPDGEPSWGLMVTAIMDNQMALEYEQIIRTRSGEIFLEIVWRLPSGGHGGVNPDYQDHNPEDADTLPDRYVVFHFHTHHIALVRGLPRPGIHAIVAFHGQEYNGERVDGNRHGGRNRRAPIIECDTYHDHTEETGYLYPGEYTNEEVMGDSPRFATMVRFANYLHQQGLLTAATYTGPGQGQLELLDQNECGYQLFDWGRSRTSSTRQFGPNGTPPPKGNVPHTGSNNQQDNDDV